MSRAGLGADPVGVAGQSTANRGRGCALVTRRLRPRRSRNPEGIRRNVGGHGSLSRAGFASEGPVITTELRRKLGRRHAPASWGDGIACSDAAVIASDQAPRMASVAELGERLGELRLCEAAALEAMRRSLERHGQLTP